MIDKQAIIDQVAEKSIFHRTAVGAILQAARHFELLAERNELREVMEAALTELRAHRSQHYLDVPPDGPVEQRMQAALRRQT